MKPRWTIQSSNSKVYRSNFEKEIADKLKGDGIKFSYESKKIKYKYPETIKTYTPDFILDNGIIIEAKGLLTTADRKKLVLVKESNPSLDIRLLFQRASNKLYKGSKTTYGEWANRNGFEWADGFIPLSWYSETK